MSLLDILQPKPVPEPRNARVVNLAQDEPRVDNRFRPAPLTMEEVKARRREYSREWAAENRERSLEIKRDSARRKREERR